MRTIRRIVTIAVVFALGIAAGLAPSVLGADEAPFEEQILFEPATSRGPDPFTAPAIAPEASGPFGGTGSDEECDPELLIRYLLDHPDRLEAWAGVHGIDPSEVPGYIRSLTPKVLTEDTPVTNHGFRNGRAYGFQSVLAAGTAVLVDEDGKIVVRCRCGNPLDTPDCPDCEPDDKCPDCEPEEECPEVPRGTDHDCEPPDEECPDDPATTHRRDCEPPDDEECPDEPITAYRPDCEPPDDDECPDPYPATHALPCPDDEPRDPQRDPRPEPRDPEDDGRQEPGPDRDDEEEDENDERPVDPDDEDDPDDDSPDEPNRLTSTTPPPTAR